MPAARTAASLLALALATGALAGPLDDGFATPPAVARPHTWWHWMNGNISRAGITADLEAMKAAGLGGAQIFNPSEGIPEGPILYNSPEWRGMVKFAAQEADRLGLELCFHNCAGWSSSGGPWVKPEHAMQTVVFSEAKAKGGAAGPVALPQPRTVAGHYRDIAVLAFPTPKDDARIANLAPKAMYESSYNIKPSDQGPAPAAPRDGVVDLSRRLGKDGALALEAGDLPAGDWTIIRFGHTPTGAVNAPSPTSGRGLEVDKMSREAFDAFWAGGVAPLLKDLGPLAGKSLRNCLIDSYEVGSQNWTPRFREEFQARRGYDPLPYLPVLTGRVIGSPLESERFLWDLRRTVGDLFADRYYSAFAETCRKNGLLSSVEPYDGPFECTQVARDADIVMGEFWSNAGMSSSCKLAASVAHVYGKPIVGAESYTAFPEVGKWTNTPASLKAVGDLMFSTGINRDIIHRYAHQPWANVNPGMTMGQWGTHLERTTTWWPQAHAWFDYLARCQFMLQQGRFVADALLLAGEDAPGTAPFREDLKAAGFDYDACGAEIILKHASVKDGRITLDSGMSYALLALPDTPYMTPELAAKVRDLLAAGATVVGPRPARSPSLRGQPKADQAVAAIAQEVWGDADAKPGSRRVGKGTLLTGMDVRQALAEVGPDFLAGPAAEGGLPAGAGGLAWIHRTTPDGEVYFVSNQKDRAVDITCSFRSQGSPELWTAEDGRRTPAPAWTASAGRTQIPLHLGPSGSVFVVLRPGPGGPHIASVQAPADPREPQAPRIAVSKAVYEAVDGSGSVDVTAKVAGMVAAGEYAIPATNANFGDPTYNHVKRLRIDYTLNGKPGSVTAAENGTARLSDVVFPHLPPAYTAEASPAGVAITAFRPGEYTVVTSGGKPERFTVAQLPAEVAVAGPWTVDFQPGRGAPASATLPTLISLSKSDDAGVRYFSGTAQYGTTFTLPALNPDQAAILDLGAVRDLAEVSVNGHDLGVWWHPPFAQDISRHLKAGENTLTVKVTNTWVNRLIGDEQFPDDCAWNGITIKAWPAWFKPDAENPLAARPVKDRLTFTTWKHWHKNDTLPDSGLLGPVVVRLGARVDLTKPTR